MTEQVLVPLWGNRDFASLMKVLRSRGFSPIFVVIKSPFVRAPRPPRGSKYVVLVQTMAHLEIAKETENPQQAYRSFGERLARDISTLARFLGLRKAYLELVPGQGGNAPIEKVKIEEAVPKTGDSSFLLRDPRFLKRVRAVLSAFGNLDERDAELFSLGRHFVLESGWVVAPRKLSESERIKDFAKPGDFLLHAAGTHGSWTLWRPKTPDFELPAGIAARYSSAKLLRFARVNVFKVNRFSIKFERTVTVEIPPGKTLRRNLV